MLGVFRDLKPFLIQEVPFFIPFALTVLIFWWFINRPLNRIKLLGDTGYLGERGHSKEDLVKKVRRHRKIGTIPPVYPNGWFCIDESRHLKRGQVKKVVALGNNLVVFRAKNSETVYVLDAYCPHMGAHLGVGGSVTKNDCIRCPFHGWTFRGDDGKCSNIPYASKVPKVAKTRSWPCVEKNKHIYIWYHCDDEPPGWEIPEIPQIVSGEWHYGGRTEHYINCYIEEVPENAADVAHLNYLHCPNILLGSNLANIYQYSNDFTGKHIWTGNWEPKPPPNQHIGVLDLTHQLELLGFEVPGSKLNVKVHQIGPGIVYLYFDLGKFGKGVLVQHLTPEEPLLQRLIHHIYIESRIPVFLAKILLWVEAKQVERDIMIWNNKCFQHKPLLVPKEKLILQHRRWYSQFFTENSLRLSEALTNNFDHAMLCHSEENDMF